ncbi:hypothetical protein N7481_007246 [Penicillium waksmanii]|uniref:uncharacterized protein n=1 Tax=Penicillium waksmanii TaxID=69791 RepID=UPI0025473E12|nr:uncharacterized protein N7481_007246 [Penicillium waksmanii]KAJ5979948.1 hypothetical protein N7481_007246 [Penicillium waksmanii]
MSKPDATSYAYTRWKWAQIKGCLPATDEAQWIVTCKPLPFKETFATCDPDTNEKVVDEMLPKGLPWSA